MKILKSLLIITTIFTLLSCDIGSELSYSDITELRSKTEYVTFVNECNPNYTFELHYNSLNEITITLKKSTIYFFSEITPPTLIWNPYLHVLKSTENFPSVIIHESEDCYLFEVKEPVEFWGFYRSTSN